jgi:hypothetical protein
LQTVIPAALAALVAYQGGLTRTTRLRAMIRANVDLLGTLPADHPNRATLEAHIGELVDVLVRRQRRRFEPFTRAGVSFGANATAALMLLGAMGGLTLEQIGVLHAASEPMPPEDQWRFIGFYTAVGLCLAFFAFRAWRRGQREHPAQPQPIQDGLVTARIGPWIGACASFAVFGLAGITLMAMDPLPRSARMGLSGGFAVLVLTSVGLAVAGFVRWWRERDLDDDLELDLDDDQATAPAETAMSPPARPVAGS